MEYGPKIVKKVEKAAEAVGEVAGVAWKKAKAVIGGQIKKTAGETAATKAGRAAHKVYKASEENKSLGKIKEYVIPNSGGKRVDFIDFSTKTIYELKPNNPRAIKKGLRQLRNYKKLIEKEFENDGWKTVLDTC